MHENVPLRFGRGRLDSLVTKGLAAYLIATRQSIRMIRVRLRQRLGRTVGKIGQLSLSTVSLLCQLSRTSFASRFCRSVPFGTIRTCGKVAEVVGTGLSLLRTGGHISGSRSGIEPSSGQISPVRSKGERAKLVRAPAQNRPELSVQGLRRRGASVQAA